MFYSGDDPAGGQPFHVPLPGRHQRFIEVVDVEEQSPLR
jgi:hypothetical protein